MKCYIRVDDLTSKALLSVDRGYILPFGTKAEPRVIIYSIMGTYSLYFLQRDKSHQTAIVVLATKCLMMELVMRSKLRCARKPHGSFRVA